MPETDTFTSEQLAGMPTKDGFRQRGMEMTRLETFTDAAFAFAVTLLVVGGGDSIPMNFDEMVNALKQVPAFAASFANIMWFWHAHHVWSRRFGLEDTKSIVLSLVLVFVVQIVASESAEVVVLTTTGGDGPEETRLWVVDLDGIQYLRAQESSGWYLRLAASPEVVFERRGLTGAFRAETDAAAGGEVNRLMQEKYGWRDTYVSWLVGSREEAIAVRLVSLNSAR